METVRLNRTSLPLVALALIMTAFGAANAADPYDSSVFEETAIRTRYGEDLRTQLWFPAVGGIRAGGAFPVIVVYTPYCDGEDVDGLFVRHGYVGALVYMPGLCGSEGHEEIFTEHVNLSGYDAIEWLGTQPWSSGKVGMFGASAEAISQVFTAQYQPPHLATIMPWVAATDFYGESIYRGGMPSTADYAQFAIILTGQWWATGMSERAKDPAKLSSTIENRWVDPDSAFAEVYLHPNRDSFWRQWTADLERIDVPLWAVGNFDDYFTTGTIKTFLTGSSPFKRLTMGWNGHDVPGPNYDDVPDNATNPLGLVVASEAGTTSPGFVRQALRWYDRFLRDEPNGIDEELREHPFEHYVEREHVWRKDSAWPIPGTEFTDLHLAAGSPMPGVTGELSSTAADPEVSDAYVYEPTQGRHNGQGPSVPTSATKPNRADTENVVGFNDPTYSGDQRLESADTLTYVTEPLAGAVEVTGPITVHLDAATSSTDTDWVVKLVDVYPLDAGEGPQPGYWNLVTTGWLKGTHRESDVRPEPIPANVEVSYTITVWPTSYLFQPGHRIGVMIGSADAARRLPNLNPAVNTIFHSSTITLPIVPRS